MGVAAERDFVEHMSWDAVARRIDAGAAAILPVGAGGKQHGLHLAAQHRPHPGGVSCEPPRCRDRRAGLADADLRPLSRLCRICRQHQPVGAQRSRLSSPKSHRDILRHGCRALFVLDTGISTRAAIAQALARPELGNALHLKIHDGPRYRRAAPISPSKAMAATPTSSRHR